MALSLRDWLPVRLHVWPGFAPTAKALADTDPFVAGRGGEAPEKPWLTSESSRLGAR